MLLRSGDLPLYNLSVVVDDIEMGITDVIRGQDHLTNTHKQILIYGALGAEVPASRTCRSSSRPAERSCRKSSRRDRFADDLPRRGFYPRRVSQFSCFARLGADGVQFAAMCAGQREVPADPRVGELMSLANHRNFSLERIHR